MLIFGLLKEWKPRLRRGWQKLAEAPGSGIVGSGGWSTWQQRLKCLEAWSGGGARVRNPRASCCSFYGLLDLSDPTAERCGGWELRMKTLVGFRVLGFIQGLLRPAFTEEHSEIQKHISTNQSHNSTTSQDAKGEGYKVEDLDIINGRRNESELSEDRLTSEESEKNEISTNWYSFYKLEMIKIQLITAHRHQTDVELEDFKQAQPDVIAHAASKIIYRLKAGGEKTTQALKSLCLRCKGIQVELPCLTRLYSKLCENFKEVAIISVDSLGFVLRACCGTQIQTLRFAFNARATSEYSAERQLNDLLFPRSHQRPQKQKSGSSK
ncbi:Pentatricopeptide repeat superfamily protein, putative isoform 2 [Hibiscus syriacus]|uniref:Pentatricopeptide repeat superfamily protein, putative isoform 2 n=1 Tax=Hibiscus syriacus TaxID=106335 RepID=A0A6A2YQA3_HIBSY|nr:Pentatricopeptide repeat superfamily protein, putative isoform 2 [Hibiscus syriacus]